MHLFTFLIFLNIEMIHNNFIVTGYLRTWSMHQDKIDNFKTQNRGHN